MAIKQPSRRITLQLLIVLFLSWIGMILWSLTQWGLHDFNTAYIGMHQLIETQRTAIAPVYQGSLLSELPMKFAATTSEAPQWLKQLSLDDFASDIINKTQHSMQLMLISSQYILIKLMILLSAIPLFALSMLAGLVDGLNQRAIRTACLGRESSYVFHRLNHYFKKLLIILLMLWLALPLHIEPAYVFIPVSLIMALMVAMTASRFKKYL